MKFLAIVVLVGCGGGTGTSGSPDAPQAPENTGYVSMLHNGYGIAGGEVDAGFWFGQPGCLSRGSVDGCEVFDCSVPNFPNAAIGGRIDVTGGSIPVFLEYQGGGYNSVITNQPLFSGGETLSVAMKAGLDVPAFTGSVTAPTKATITAPIQPASAAPLTITRTSVFSTRWTGGSGTLMIALAGGPNNTQRVTCKFDASAGSASIPTDLLMTLPTGAGSFAMATLTETSEIAGDWAVNVQGLYTAVWPDDAEVTGATMIQ